MERNNDFRTKEIKKKFGYSHHEISLLNQNEYDELLKVEGNIENVHNELRTNYQQKEHKKQIVNVHDELRTSYQQKEHKKQIVNVHDELRTNYQQKEQNEMRKSDEKSEESLPSTSWLSYLTSWIY